MEAIGMIVIGLLFIGCGGVLMGIGLASFVNAEAGEKIAKYSMLFLIGVVTVGLFLTALLAFSEAASLLF